jgi:hypothetical protein
MSSVVAITQLPPVSTIILIYRPPVVSDHRGFSGARRPARVTFPLKSSALRMP